MKYLRNLEVLVFYNQKVFDSTKFGYETIRQSVEFLRRKILATEPTFFITKAQRYVVTDISNYI